METYIYTLKLKEAYHDQTTWNKEVYEIIETHYNRLKNDFEIGRVINVGKTKDVIIGFGFVLFNASTLAEANKYMNEDEAILKGMKTGACFSYRVVF